MSGDPTKPGTFYGRTRDGRLVEIGSRLGDAEPDLWICRRVIDYPPPGPPREAASDLCTTCGAAIAYNPARQVIAPKVCMQCAGIQPLPFP
jgi:hypothetical protein